MKRYAILLIILSAFLCGCDSCDSNKNNAEKNIGKYESLVDKCQEFIDSEDIYDLEKVSRLISEVEEMETLYSQYYPDTYNKVSNLRSDFKEAVDMFGLAITDIDIDGYNADGKEIIGKFHYETIKSFKADITYNSIAKQWKELECEVLKGDYKAEMSREENFLFEKSYGGFCESGSFNCAILPPGCYPFKLWDDNDILLHETTLKIYNQYDRIAKVDNIKVFKNNQITIDFDLYVENATDIECKAAVYFFDNKDTFIENEYADANYRNDENIVYSKCAFTPDKDVYNTKIRLSIPTKEFGQPIDNIQVFDIVISEIQNDEFLSLSEYSFKRY